LGNKKDSERSKKDSLPLTHDPTFALNIAYTLYTVKKNNEIPGFILTIPSRDWDWVNFSRPGRVW
jgi:hypothetical protein